MSVFQNPAAQAFVAEIKTELLLAQVLVRRMERGFELRHVEDRNVASEKLRLVAETGVRALAQFTVSGAFRPLKSAPNLQAGWRFIAGDERQMEFALNTFYPGAIADWFAVRAARTAPTHYREFTSRQSGMYRITAMLPDEKAAPMIRACCLKRFCWKQRLWTVNGLLPDSPENKSLIPCLEPCAILLEFARKAMRLAQQEERGEPLNQAATDASEVREADFENSANPRRLQLNVENQKMNV